MVEAAMDGRMKLRNMMADCLMVENGESIVFRAWRSGFCTRLTWPDYGFSFPRKVEEFQLLYFYISFFNEVQSKLAVLSLWILAPVIWSDNDGLSRDLSRGTQEGLGLDTAKSRVSLSSSCLDQIVP